MSPKNDLFDLLTFSLRQATRLTKYANGIHRNRLPIDRQIECHSSPLSSSSWPFHQDRCRQSTSFSLYRAFFTRVDSSCGIASSFANESTIVRRLPGVSIVNAVKQYGLTRGYS